jgi:hypothetical protein
MFVFGVDVQSVHFQSNCHRYEMSQWTKCPVDVPFGSKCSVDVPLVDVPSRHRSAIGSAITDSDLAAMRSKFPFLRDFSDSFIRATKPDCILKMESTTLKIKESECSRDADDKLAANRAALGTSPKILKEGADDRWKILHEGRFLPGAGCSAAKLWLSARSSLGLTGGAALGNYDMHSTV